MAIKKIQIKPPDNNYVDVLHPETDSTMVLMGDGNTLEQFKTSHLADDTAHGIDSCLLTTGGNVSGEINMQDNLLTRPYIKDYAEYLSVNAAASGTVTLNIETANNFNLTIAGATTLVFSNPSASGRVCSITIKINMPATLYAITFPSSVKWAGDKIPTFNVSKTAILTFVTFDGGARWYGMVAGTEFTT